MNQLTVHTPCKPFLLNYMFPVAQQCEGVSACGISLLPTLDLINF